MECPRCHQSNPPGVSLCENCKGPLEAKAAGQGSWGSGWSAAGATEGVTSAFPSATTIHPGTVLGGRYEILQLLGEGGMGAVYKANDRAVDRLVALKVIRPELASRPEMLQRFKQELILARQITHKNVIRIFDFGEADGTKFISMDFVDGKDLKSIVREKGKLPAEEARNVILQVGRALNAAHSEGVIHRDLKPQNIMVDGEGRVTVMDFGIARSMESPGMTQTGMVIGTPEYMSPEQGRGETVDGRSDLYSLGIILYELLTGHTPHHADTALAIMLKRERERPRPPRDTDAQIPQSLNRVVMKSLELDPAKRYQTALEVLADLESRPTARTGTTLRAATWTQGLALRMPRFRLVGRIVPWGIVPAAVTVAIVAIAVLAFRFRSKLVPSFQPRGPHALVSVLVADFTNHTGDPIFDDTLEPMASVALEGASFINAFNRGDARKLAEKLPHPTDKLDEQSARLVAINQGVSAVVTGEISRRGDHYSISATALDAVTGNVLAHSEIAAANKDEVLLDIPKLAAPIRQGLGDTTPESVQIEKAGGAFTTSNLEAVHEYGLAMEQEFAGNIQGALQAFSKAAELDPNFARAYAGMAGQARNLGRRQEAEKYAKLAMEHVDRMTERERYRVRGVYYMTTGNWQKCVEEHSALVEQYPADNIGQLNLAICSAYLHNMPRAFEAARRALELAPKDLMARNNFTLLACYAGDFQTCERGGRELQDLNPSLANGYLLVAYAQQGQGELAKSAETYRELEKIGARGTSLEALGLANLALYEGKYRQAAQILEQSAAANLAAKEPDQAAENYAMLADAELLGGEKQSALAAAEKALANSQSAKIRFLVARTFLEAGESAKADKLASSLAAELAAGPQAYAKLILGEAALKNRLPSQAVQLFTAAKNLDDTWIVHFDLGRAYLDAGAFVEADSEFDQCLKRRGEALELFMDDMPTSSFFPPVYYYEGRVQEGLKSPGASDSYKTYLSIRGAAGEDPLLPDVHHRLGQ